MVGIGCEEVVQRLPRLHAQPSQRLHATAWRAAAGRLGGVAAQRAEWEKLANTARFEIYGTMEAEFAHVLRSGVYGTK